MVFTSFLNEKKKKKTRLYWGSSKAMFKKNLTAFCQISLKKVCLISQILVHSLRHVCKSYFPGKIEKNISKWCLLKFLPSMQSVNNVEPLSQYNGNRIFCWCGLCTFGELRFIKIKCSNVGSNQYKLNAVKYNSLVTDTIRL